MITRSSLPQPQSTEREYARDYLLGMLEELAKIATQAGETEMAIHLQAILDVARVTGRRRSA